MADVTKELLIKIGTDGGLTAVSTVEGINDSFVKTALGITGVNSALDLCEKAFGYAKAAASWMWQELLDVGAYSKAKAGLEGLAAAHHVNADSIIEDISRITGGTLAMTDMIQMASYAIKKGFSEDQISTITAYAKAYVGVFGGSVIETSEAIEKAIATGQGRLMNFTDIAISKGEDIKTVMSALDKKRIELGDGVFTLGSVVLGVAQSVKNATEEVLDAISKLVGKTDIKEMGAEFRAVMAAIGKESPELAMAIFYPIRDTAKIVWNILKALFEDTSLFGPLFDQTSSLTKKIDDFAKAFGSAEYEIAIMTAKLVNLGTSSIDAIAIGVSGLTANILSGIIDVGEATHAFSIERLAKLKVDLLTLDEITKKGLFHIEIGPLDDAYKKFTANIEKASEAHVALATGADEAAKHIQKVGEAFEKVKDSTKGAKDAADEHIHSIMLWNETTADAFDKTNSHVLKVRDSFSYAKDDLDTLWDELKDIGDDEDIPDTTKGGVSGLVKTTSQPGGVVSTNPFPGWEPISGELSKLNDNFATIIRTSTSAESKPTVSNTSAPTNETGKTGLSNIGKIQMEVTGSDGPMKDLVDYVIRQCTLRAVSEGSITAGV